MQHNVTHTQRGVTRAPWSIAQFVAIAIGLLFVVIGGVALARTGIDTNNLYVLTSVGGLAVTTLMGGLMFVFGLVMLAVGALPGASRVGMATLGMLSLGFGIIVAIQPSSFAHDLGITSSGAWLFIVSGGVALLAAMLAPTFHSVGRSNEVETDDTLVDNDRTRIR